MLEQIRLPPSEYAVRRAGKFLIIGNGSIGGKGLEGFNKQDKIVRSGMVWPETVVFATDFFDGLMKTAEGAYREPDEKEERLLKSRIGTSLLRARLRGIDRRIIEEALSNIEKPASITNLQKEIAQCGIGEKEFELVSIILAQFYHQIYAVRSSHLNEFGGTGKYLSDFGWNEPSRIVKIMKRVVASSADGKMAVLLQPLAAEPHEGITTKYYPIAGGCAYTTRIIDGSGKIKIALGLGTKVLRNGAETYFFKDGKLERTEEDPGYGALNMLVKNSHGNFEIYNESVGIQLQVLEAAKTRILESLVVMLKQLEKECGRPQYIEFAATKDGIYCVQICDTEPLASIGHEEKTGGKLIASGKRVNGIKRINITDVVFVSGNDPKELDKLRELNKKLDGYLFAIGSGVFSKLAEQPIYAKWVSNASAILVNLMDSNGNSAHPDEQTAGNHVMERFGTGFPWLVCNRTPEFLWKYEMKGVTHIHLDRPMEFYVNEALGVGRLNEL